MTYTFFLPFISDRRLYMAFCLSSYSRMTLLIAFPAVGSL